MMEPPSRSLGIDIGNSPLKGQPPQARTKNFKRAKPKILIPTPGLYYEKNIIQNDTHMYLNLHCSATSNTQDTDPRRSPLTG